MVTHADGRPLDDHPAVGSGRAEGLAVLAAATAALHELLLAALDAGIDASSGLVQQTVRSPCSRLSRGASAT